MGRGRPCDGGGRLTNPENIFRKVCKWQIVHLSSDRKAHTNVYRFLFGTILFVVIQVSDVAPFLLLPLRAAPHADSPASPPVPGVSPVCLALSKSFAFI